MKHLKVLVLAAVAALVVMALAGAGTASAAGGVLCEEIEEPCGKEGLWKEGVHMTFPLKAATKTKLTATNGEALLECEESKLTGKVLTVGAKAAKATVEVKSEWLTWGKCTTPLVTVTPGILEFEYRAGEAGTKGTVFTKNIVITAELFGVRCYYKAGTGTDIGKYTPGAEGKDGILAVSAVTAKENTVIHPSSFLCPSNIVWDGEYTLSGTTPLYIKGE